jgi:hypothetical protein
MIIENKKTIIRYHLLRLLFIVLLTVIIVLLFYIDIIDKETLGIDQKFIAFILIGMYIVYYFWGLARNYHYFYYSDLSPSKLIIRYYSLAPLNKKQNSIEIRKDTLYKFEMINKALGFRRYLVVYAKTPQGLAKYPPVSISLLDTDQRRDLTTAISLYSKKND